MRSGIAMIIALALLASIGCGGSSGGDAGGTTVTSVEVLPQNAGEIQPGDTQFFVAKAIAGKQVVKESNFDGGFTFEVNPAVAGTISNGGLFTASAELPADVPTTIKSTYMGISGFAIAIVKGTGMISVDLGYSPASLFNTLENVRVQLSPIDPPGQPITIDLGNHAVKTVFRFLRAGRYNVFAAGMLYGVNVAQGEKDNIVVSVGVNSNAFIEIRPL